MADLKNIVVLYGGSSSEREVSLQSGNRVYDALIDLGHEVFLIDLNEIEDLEHLKQHDLVFIALHGHEGESGQLQKKLDELNILYTGSGYLACSNTWNKSSFKDILEKESLPTPRGFSVNKLHDDIQSPFEIFHEKYNIEIKDLFLKPEEDGSSIDIFEISSKNDLINAIQLASNPDRAFIFEEAIKYKEYTVSIINNKCLPILEIKTNNSFYDYDAKYLSNDTQLIEANLNKSEKEIVTHLSIKAFNAFNCSGWARVDILQDTHGSFYILEINTVPGMTSHSCLPRSAELNGISYKELINTIIKDAEF